MKIRLNDNKTIIEDVMKIHEQIRPTTSNSMSQSLDIYVCSDSGITGDDIITYKDTIGFDKFTIMSDTNEVLEVITEYPTLNAIHTSYIENVLCLVLIFVRKDEL